MLDHSPFAFDQHHSMHGPMALCSSAHIPCSHELCHLESSGGNEAGMLHRHATFRPGLSGEPGVPRSARPEAIRAHPQCQQPARLLCDPLPSVPPKPKHCCARLQVFSALAAAAVLLWRVRSETASAEAAADDPTGKGNRGFSKLPTVRRSCGARFPFFSFLFRQEPGGSPNPAYRILQSVVGRTGGVETAGDSVPLVYRYLAAVVFAAASAGLSGISMTTADEVLRVSAPAILQRVVCEGG